MVTLFVVGDVLGWVTHDPQTAGGWGGGGPAALVGLSLALCTFAVVGALISSAPPAQCDRWIMLAIGFTWALDATLEGYAVYGLKTHPGSLPGGGLRERVRRLAVGGGHRPR